MTRKFIPLIPLVIATLNAAECSPRNILMNHTEGVPREEACRDGQYRCTSSVPEVCQVAENGTSRFWPILPLDEHGNQTACQYGCEVLDSGVSRCAPTMDGGVR